MASNWEVIQTLTKSSQARLQRLMMMRTMSAESKEEGGKENGDVPMTASPTSQECELKLNTIHQILPGKLSFVLFETEADTKKAIMEQRDVYFFSSDFHEDYAPFFNDFGPVNLGVVYQFCKLISGKISDPRLGSRVCTYYAEADGPRRTNAAFLLGAYLVIQHGWTPEDTNNFFVGLSAGLLVGYKHALHAHSDFKLSVLDCLSGIKKAMNSKWFDTQSFDLDRYHLLENPVQFDLHVICPKFVAFRGPDSRDSRFHAPEHYLDLFKTIGVTAVVRLSDVEAYNGQQFERVGIHMHDLKLKVGKCPSLKDVDDFLAICDKEEGVIAVHCTGGRGRTATMIAVWMMRREGWRAREAIAWLRIVRPGSVLGPQQEFLLDLE